MIIGLRIRVVGDIVVVDKEEDDTDFLGWKRCVSMEEALKEISNEWQRVSG